MGNKIKMRYNRFNTKIDSGNGYNIIEDVVEDTKTGVIEPYLEWKKNHNEDDFLETIQD